MPKTELNVEIITMKITDRSDTEIIAIVNPMIDEVVEASNRKDWVAFSKYQREEEANDPSNRRNVEAQWKSSKLLSSLDSSREILGVLRRDDVAVVYWKQTGTSVSGEYLASYHVKQFGSELKEVGFLIT